MNPFDEREMFMSSLTGCLYNSFKINEQLDWLSYHEDLIERGNLVWENGDEFYIEKKYPNGEIEVKPNKLNWVPNEKGEFEKLKDWFPREPNNVYERNGFFLPNGIYDIRLGCDPFKYDKTKDARKSDCAAYAYQMPDLINESYTYSDTFVMRYAKRPPTTDLQYQSILKMAWYCGTQVLIERNIGESPKKYFQSKKCAGFLMWLPNEVEFGIYTDGTGNTVQAVCDYTEAYIEKHVSKVYFPELLGEKSGWLGFEVANTQKYDDAMGSGFALIASKVKRIKKNESNLRGIESVLPYQTVA